MLVQVDVSVGGVSHWDVQLKVRLELGVCTHQQVVEDVEDSLSCGSLSHTDLLQEVALEGGVRRGGRVKGTVTRSTYICTYTLHS